MTAGPISSSWRPWPQPSRRRASWTALSISFNSAHRVSATESLRRIFCGTPSVGLVLVPDQPSGKRASTSSIRIAEFSSSATCAVIEQVIQLPVGNIAPCDSDRGGPSPLDHSTDVSAGSEGGRQQHEYGHSDEPGPRARRRLGDAMSQRSSWCPDSAKSQRAAPGAAEPAPTPPCWRAFRIAPPISPKPAEIRPPSTYRTRGSRRRRRRTAARPKSGPIRGRRQRGRAPG